MDANGRVNLDSAAKQRAYNNPTSSPAGERGREGTETPNEQYPQQWEDQQSAEEAEEVERRGGRGGGGGGKAQESGMGSASASARAIGDVERAVRLRRRAFDLLLLAVRQRREENERHLASKGRVLPDWPELLKAAAEAGQNILGVGSLAERRAIFQVLHGLLDEMMGCCHEEQQPAVQLMIAHMHSERGIIEFDAATNNAAAHSRANAGASAGSAVEIYAVALQHFEQALLLTEALAVRSGNHTLCTPLSHTANTLAASGRFDEAFPLYHRLVIYAKVFWHFGILEYYTTRRNIV
jgi:hypothetical protein